MVGSFVVIVLILFLWNARSQQANERARLAGELAIATKKLGAAQLERLYEQTSDLETRINRISARTNDAGNIFYSPKSIGVTDTLIDTATKLGVEIKELKTTGPQKENVQGVPLISLALDIKVEGGLAGLTNFVVALSERFPTSVVRSAEIEIPGGSRPAASVTGQPSVKILLIIYSYQGEANG